MLPVRTEIRWIVFLILAIFLSGCTAVARHSSRIETPAVPILLYHHIQELPKNASAPFRRWTLSPKKFEEQMEWLSDHGYHVMTMAQLTGHLKHREPLPSKPIILTFDDGWRNHYTVVFPILKKHHLVGTFFIITGSVGHSAYVDWKELQEMSAQGMDIQTHSMTHPDLTKLSDKDAVREITGSKQAIETHLNKPVVLFAYPNGTYSEKLIGMVRAAGFEAATTISGKNGGYIYRADKTYTFVRYAIERGTSLENLARARGF